MNTLSNLPIAIMGLGVPEMLLILGILVLMFGARKLPELAKGLGKSIKEFKKASNESDDDTETAASPEKRPSQPKSETTKPTHGAN